MDTSREREDPDQISEEEIAELDPEEPMAARKRARVQGNQEEEGGTQVW